MRLSAIITLNERDIAVIDTVFDSMRDQAHDEFVIVLDRTPEPLAEYVRRYWSDDERTKFVVIPGEPGWKSPVRAWNAGFNAATGDHLYCFSSETVQAAGNIDKARRMLEREPRTLVFGRAECSCGPQGREVNWGGAAPGNLLCDAAHPRPLGFIWFAPMEPVKAIGGFDPAFYGGYWYDENDLFIRLWRTGLDFAFDDSVSGVHLHHERPVLDTPAGRAGVAHNAALQIRKHGALDPFQNLFRVVEFGVGRQVWRHL